MNANWKRRRAAEAFALTVRLDRIMLRNAVLIWAALLFFLQLSPETSIILGRHNKGGQDGRIHNLFGNPTMWRAPCMRG